MDSKISNDDEFKSYVDKQLNNLKKSTSKTTKITELDDDSLTCNSDYIYSIYFTEQDSKPAIKINGITPVLECWNTIALFSKKMQRIIKEFCIQFIFLKEVCRKNCIQRMK